MANFESYIVLFGTLLFPLALSGLFARWAIDFLNGSV